MTLLVLPLLYQMSHRKLEKAGESEGIAKAKNEVVQ